MLQSKQYGGYESHPVEFAEAVMKIAGYNSAAGWVAGVVGVHPWEASGFTRELQDEIWGLDPDTWISSPYAPLGVLEPVDGGYRIQGRITFSSGGEACEWAITGALLQGPDGAMQMRHIVLPRDDYWFDQDSWNVIGLRGTGSKDLVVDDAFVPAHRVYDPYDFDHGQNFEKVGNDAPLYRIPFPTIFSYAINCASQGIAEGAMAAVMDNALKRVDARGTRTLEDPFQMAMIAECAAEVRAGRAVLIADGHRMYDEAVRDGSLGLETRAEIRANGVRAIRRSVDAVERVFNYAGGRSLQLSSPVSRGLRDAKTTLAHICNTQHPIYQFWAQVNLGLDYDLGKVFA
jgi:alkylation response protein AidB-like acyl-CoA dehydrogenase